MYKHCSKIFNGLFVNGLPRTLWNAVRPSLPRILDVKIHATHSKQMVVAFFEATGLIYTNYMPRGTRVNANYIVGALGKFLTILRQKRRVMAVQEWFIH